MELLSSKLKGKEKNTLYIIGNGFDLFHGLKTKFVHFCSWLKLQDKAHEDFVYDMENLYPYPGIHGNMLWKNFEELLGRFSEQICNIHNLYGVSNEQDNYENVFNAANKFRDVTSKIPVYLREWINSLNIIDIHPRLDLSKESRYLSFNYTLLLEEVYCIPASQVLHIHGCINDPTPLVSGHDDSFPEDTIENSDPIIERSLQCIAKEGNALQKPWHKLIEENNVFFEALKDIENIVVFGFSMSRIDWHYIEEIVRRTQEGTHWYFIVRDDMEKKHYEARVEKINLSHNNYIDSGNRYTNKIHPKNCEYITSNDLGL